MKNILCYGDSNTWGLPPGEDGRHDWPVRWTGQLQEKLGSEYRIIEAGLSGRTTCFDDPFSAHRNGLTQLPVALETHFPIDLLLIMLGTNDLKVTYNLTPFHIAKGAATLVKLAQQFEPAIPHILLVAPPHMVPTEDAENAITFMGGVEKSQGVAECYSAVAQELGCHFLDASKIAKFSAIDGIHMDAENHGLLAQGLSAALLDFL